MTRQPTPRFVHSTSAQPINVLIADDHPIVRAGLKAVISAECDPAEIRVVAEVGQADAAVEEVRQRRGGEEEVHVVLMDLRFGAGPAESATAAGVSATAALRALPDPPQVLVVTNYSTDGDVVGAVSAGAVGYLLKDAPAAELVGGIRSAARGESVMSSQVMGKLMGQLNNQATALTSRELEVLRLVGEGKSNRDIARSLVLTEATVKSHLSHIFTKLNVTNRTSAVAIAREQGRI